ncbi:MAG: LytTR family DNA-binding domain-containing protein [Bacillota bacterium]|nr:LytTR family DNA-binding domain-containing protein [Bacillota bacterium]
MKIKINVDESLSDDEIIINCRGINDDIQHIQQAIMQSIRNVNITFYKGECEYYLPLKSILFFETSQNSIDAHTIDDIYQVKNKLYELEQILPHNFIRISKFTIININSIYSIDKSLTSARSIQFKDTYKQVYVSRNYYKNLKNRLEERRIFND